MRILIMFSIVLGACAGDEVDQGNGPVCMMVLYDKCQSEHDCTSNQCQNFVADGFQVCTQGCSAALPCPDNNGVAVPCDSMGYCKPAAATECRVLPTP